MPKINKCLNCLKLRNSIEIIKKGVAGSVLGLSNITLAVGQILCVDINYDDGA